MSNFPLDLSLHRLTILSLMKKQLVIIILALGMGCVPALCASKISGSLFLLSPTTNKELTSARIGQRVKLKVSLNDFNLIANKDVQFTYMLSVLPKGSSTPTTISGKLSGKFTLPRSEGGAAKTKSETASWAGAEGGEEILVIPDFMPVGVATITITAKAADAGAVNLSKSIRIKL